MRTLALAFAALLGCGAGAAPEASSAHVAAARTRWPDTTRALLARGRTLYVDRCSTCHALVLPADRAPAQWPGLVDRMADRSALEPEEREAVARYLVAASSVSRARSR